MYGQNFYNETTRRLVAVFGTHFNDIRINRKTNDGDQLQELLVPISYGPIQKFLAKLKQDPTLSAPAMSLPRMSFEISGIQYSPDRKLGSSQRLVCRAPTGDPTSMQSVYTPTPMDVNFQLNIMVKYNEDGMKIVEQILPFFKPSVTPRVKMLDGIDQYFDIPIVLNGVTQEDAYDSSFEERRVLIWTLDFTMKAYYFGPTTTAKTIKFITIDLFDSMKPEGTRITEVLDGSASNVIITHNLGRPVTVEFYDKFGNPQSDNGTLKIQNVDDNNVQLTDIEPISGTVYIIV